MKIIVPMADVVHVCPHSLTVPKPLIPVAETYHYRLVEDIAKILKEPIEEIAFILGEAFFGDDVVKV
jgi:glucose-1-phosphate thymidylyltransferase